MSLSEGKNQLLGATRCVFGESSNVGGLRRLPLPVRCGSGLAHGLQIVCNPPLPP
ncbi:hypothetical protein [Paraburkholderia bannensis]|uniref:hypothetical protein n=1 Tax=Paraburkholderia bannensis TaxID=765414 RepID=UPI002AB6F1DB|nr:hypothetical protein [Paraburkholderia bannensis]